MHFAPSLQYSIASPIHSNLWNDIYTKEPRPFVTWRTLSFSRNIKFGRSTTQRALKVHILHQRRSGLKMSISSISDCRLTKIPVNWIKGGRGETQDKTVIGVSRRIFEICRNEFEYWRRRLIHDRDETILKGFHPWKRFRWLMGILFGRASFPTSWSLWCFEVKLWISGMPCLIPSSLSDIEVNVQAVNCHIVHPWIGYFRYWKFTRYQQIQNN